MVVQGRVDNQRLMRTIELELEPKEFEKILKRVEEVSEQELTEYEKRVIKRAKLFERFSF